MGFPSVLQSGLPSLEAARARERVEEESLHLKLLLTLMAVVEDGNVLYYIGPEGLKELQSKALLLSEASLPFDRDAWKLFDEIVHFCERNRVSPGGSADLLAVSLFLDSIARNYSYCYLDDRFPVLYETRF